MTKKTKILGIDAGSVTVSAVEIDRNGTILRKEYRFHNGYPKETLKNILSDWERHADTDADVNNTDDASDSGKPAGWRYIAATGAASSLLISPDETVDDKVAAMSAAKHLHNNLGSLLTIGGEKFGLFTWNGKGEYRSYKGNTSCAAGTGGFIDQQAERLGMSGAAELSELAESNKSEPPKIATRCAVFAKTDLTHAQQEGFSLEAITDGLSRGLAGNLLDVLLEGKPPEEPLVICGGVANNKAVVRHIGEMTGLTPVVDEYAPLYGSYGAALHYLEKIKNEPDSGLSVTAENKKTAPDKESEKNHTKLNVKKLRTAKDIIAPESRLDRKNAFLYPPLQLEKSDYPDFECFDYWEVPIKERKGRYPVEVEIFDKPPEKAKGILGIDIGSTSTKAVLINENDNSVILGLYTRTAGRPVDAMKAVLMALEEALEKYSSSEIPVEACATTGSGRKLVGEILGADLILDEITAHARAAVQLDPEVDTIIEIGGQDAKFTTLSGGRVTNSVMNNVCAAGTGSFLEEQAARLGCVVTDYASRTEGVKSPVTSDRCTVFMQRDLNHLVSAGYSVEEVLASALHSVRENYLNRVALRNQIGKKVFFQGATARIKTLVAAFEQALDIPILVSRYCRHTGALGAALQLADERKALAVDLFPGMDLPGKFRGISLWKQKIPVRTEVCELCRNTCKITVAEVNGETAAFGFLCGRDYGTEKYVPKAGEGSTPLSERTKLFKVKPVKKEEAAYPYTLGIPAALYMSGELPFWEKFFSLLKINIIVDRNPDPIEAGKALSGAEFCAPMTALYGRVSRLLEKADYVFVPFYMEEKARSSSHLPKLSDFTRLPEMPRLPKFDKVKLPENPRQALSAIKEKIPHFENPFQQQTQTETKHKSAPRDKHSYCYYTQFAPSLVKQIAPEGKVLTPMVKLAYRETLGFSHVKETIEQLPGGAPSVKEMEKAWKEARRWFEEKMHRLSEFHKEMARGDDINIVLLGRPYVVSDTTMNKNIPKLFADLGVRVFDMDMIDSGKSDDLPWNYASKILQSAQVITEMENTYPVLVTSFMCSPDSFLIPYAREVWEKQGKPYLILELDGHGSNVGYGTRVEAAIRAFRNHYNNKKNVPAPEKYTFSEDYSRKGKASDVRNKVLLIPNWDNDVLPLVAANLRREGFDARLIEETEELIRKGGRISGGQCLPLNIIASETAAYIKKYKLNPAETALWIVTSQWSCNIPLYPKHIKFLLRQEGEGLEHVHIHMDDVGLTATTPLSLINTYYAFMFGGFLKSIACRIRPYETNKGETDRVLKESRAKLIELFEGQNGLDKMETIKEIISRFESVPRIPANRPKVAIFGDFYVRDNEIINQDLIRFIEKHGGEVITLPYTRFAKLTADATFQRFFREKRYKELAVWKIFLTALKLLEKSYNKLFEPLAGPEDPHIDNPEEVLRQYGVTMDHHGESMENLLKIHYLTSRHNDITLFVQTSPSFCCAGLVTEAMRKKIEEVTNIPVVSITYDGTGGNKNEVIVPYLAFPRNQENKT